MHPGGGRAELGPTTLRGKSDELNRLIAEIGLEEEIVETDPSARHRFVLRDGRPVEVPSSPRGAIETGLFSLRGKLRALGERFVGRSAGDSDESVADFFRRRFGREVLDYGVDPFVAGIYAGDPSRLSLKHTFPMLHDMEREYGSILRGGLARMRASRGKSSGGGRRPFSFRSGLSRLPERLAELCGAAVHLETAVMAIERVEGGWSILTRRGRISADRIVLATGAEMAADLVRPLDPAGADLLDMIESSPVAVQLLLYDPSAFPARPEGFGMLVPSVEGREILGVIYTSSIYPDRVPSDRVLLSVFLGGARHPELTGRSHDTIRRVASDEIASIYGATADPIDGVTQIWRPGIPQYTVGYDRILDGITALEERHPGLRLIGSYRGGVSVPDCVEGGLGGGTR